MENGRMKDVIIEDDVYIDPRTGVEVVRELCFIVWADADMLDTIKAVEGVTNVYSHIEKTKFYVYYDRRYSREYLKLEIEAAILCK